MRVYHGSIQSVRNPRVERGRPSTDFGKGFYTTTNIEQAEHWALYKKKNAGNDAKAVVCIYEVDNDLLDKNEYDTLRFREPDEVWLTFVTDCRASKTHSHDMVFGAVANDKIYETLELYEDGILNIQETIARLKVKPFYNQISFHSPAAVRELRFIESTEV
jgi:hypothetical protein